MAAVNPQTPRMVADAAAGFSIAGSSFAWIGAANEILTLIATVSAIFTAIFAIRYHHTARKKLLDEEDHDE